MYCIKCGYTDIRVFVGKIHKKAVCANCLNYIKFLSKTEFRNFKVLHPDKLCMDWHDLSKTKVKPSKNKS